MQTPEERERMPEERISDERMSEGRMSDERMSDERMPDERMSDERMRDERMSDERMSDERMAGEQTREERMHEQPMREANMPEREMERGGMDRTAMPGERSYMSIPDAETYMRRFDAVQAEFIDEPRRAVEKAESLVSEAIDRMMDSLKEELHRSRTQSDGNGADETEQLRIAMKRYRDLLHSFSRRSA